jgi:hypothetical protein
MQYLPGMNSNNSIEDTDHTGIHLVFFRQFWCKDIHHLTPEIARNLIGQNICVLFDLQYPHNLCIVEYEDYSETKISQVQNMTVIREESGWKKTDEFQVCWGRNRTLQYGDTFVLYQCGGILWTEKKGYRYRYILPSIHLCFGSTPFN